MNASITVDYQAGWQVTVPTFPFLGLQSYVQLAALPKNYQIAGVVFSEGTTPAPQVCCILRHQKSLAMVAATYSDYQGHYSFQGLPDGLYLIEFLSPHTHHHYRGLRDIRPVLV